MPLIIHVFYENLEKKNFESLNLFENFEFL